MGPGDALLLISGGVDSTVAGALLLKTLPHEKVHLLYIDTGLMRKAESDEVMRNLRALGATHLHMVDAEDEFLRRPAGLEDPEAKRKAIGDLLHHYPGTGSREARHPRGFPRPGHPLYRPHRIGQGRRHRRPR